jgi:hypothetical protein
MKRIPVFAGLALVAVMATVTFLVRPTQAENDPCYDSCGDASQRISDMSSECYSRAQSQSPIYPEINFNSGCTDPSGGNPGSYNYSCTWHWVYTPPGCYFPSCVTYGGGGFGGGGKIDPTDAACLP